MTAPDSRLSDTRVTTARKPVWDQGETEWDDNNQLRPGFVERLAPYDPTPEYSRLDRMDGLDAPVEPVTDPHGLSALGIGIIATATLLAACAVVVLIALGVAWIAGYRP